MDVNFIHVHENEIVALYYCNLTWQPEWGGETLFYKDNKKIFFYLIRMFQID